MKSNLYEKRSFPVAKAKRKGEYLPRRYNVVERDYIGRNDSQRPSLRVLKRASPYNSSFLESYTGNTQKAKALGIEGKRQKVHPASIPKKVDAVAYPREIPSGKYTHESLYERLRGYGDLERANIGNAIIDCTVAERSEQNDSDNDACSVGSCSVTDEAENMFHNCSINLPCLDRNLLFTGAESSYCTGHKESCCHCLEEKVGVTVHGLEMHAYRCTLEALYASGPLSWEQEELLTNLRIMLNISNDEHLTELRNLIHPGSGPLLEACSPASEALKGVSVLAASLLTLAEGGCWHPLSHLKNSSPPLIGTAKMRQVV